MSELNNQKLEIIDTFLYKYLKAFTPPSILQFISSKYSLFPKLNNSLIITENDYPQIDEASRYHLILVDFQSGHGYSDIPSIDEPLVLPNNCKNIISYLSFLEPGGNCICFLEPNIFTTYTGRQFETHLSSLGYFINAIINTPTDILEPFSSSQPLMVIISRDNYEKVLVGELVDDIQAKFLFKSYDRLIEGKTIIEAETIEPMTFLGFDKINNEKLLKVIEQQYSHLNKKTLGDLTINIQSGNDKTDFLDLSNCIYIPKYGKRIIVNNLEYIEGNHKHYYQVQLSDRIDSEYVVSFFRDEKYGKLALENAKSPGVLPIIGMQELKNINIFFPSDMQEQKIITTRNMLDEVKQFIYEQDNELNENINNVNNVYNRIIPVYSGIINKTDVEKVKELIQESESKYVEFKETLTLNIKNNELNDNNVKKSSLKNIVAFLNTEGGNLLIGVSNAEEITGINEEMSRCCGNSIDIYRNRLIEFIKTSIGLNYENLIKLRFVNISDKWVCWVECMPSSEPVYLEKDEFYYRADGRAEQLKGREFEDYYEIRFRNKKI